MRLAARRRKSGFEAGPALLLLARELGDALEARGPGRRRLAPDLPARRQRGALVEGADPQRVGRRVADRAGVDGRAAIRAEGLGALVAAFRRLDINLRLAA